MVGPDAEHEGIIRAGARFVEAMACARVPKLVPTLTDEFRLAEREFGFSETSSVRGSQRRRGCWKGTREATGSPRLVITICSPASTRRSRSAVLLRKSRDATLIAMRQT